jgi:predicted flavoprotein YhiN
LANLSDTRLAVLASAVNGWHVKPVGTEGYRTAEVVDVTGHLGGFNFQGTWFSGYMGG